MTSPLLKIFQRQIVPWVEQFGLAKVAIAAPSWRVLQASEMELPQGVAAARKPLKSKRIPRRGKKQYGNAALIDAYWPEDHLQSSRAPMLEFVVSGAVVFPLSDYELRCRPGHGILTPPGVAHSDGSHLMLDTSVPGNVSCEVMKMRPYKGGLECWLSHTRNGEHWSHRSAEESCRIANNQAVFYIETLTEEMQKGKARHLQIGNALLAALVNLVLRELQETPTPLPAAIGREERAVASDSSPIDLAKGYIRSHLGEHLTLNRVARYVYMSERSFSHLFRQATGQSFMEYLTDRRFEEAATLLKTTDWSIEQIANFVGIKQGRLRMLFHQRTGASPMCYRQTIVQK